MSAAADRHPCQLFSHSPMLTHMPALPRWYRVTPMLYPDVVPDDHVARMPMMIVSGAIGIDVPTQRAEQLIAVGTVQAGNPVQKVIHIQCLSAAVRVRDKERVHGV